MDRFWAMLCSSPISTKIWRYSASLLPSDTGINNPQPTIAVSRPRVFKVTVLPPVLGPVITRVS